MAYESMFDLDIDDYRVVRRNMWYNSTFDDVLANLSCDDLSNESLDFKVLRMLNAPRVVRGALDYKIGFDARDPVGFVRAATDLALEAYSNQGSISDEVESFIEEVSRKEEREVLQYFYVRQNEDATTWRHSCGPISHESAEYLTNTFPDGKILFLMLAHGGVMAGMDVFLRYKDMTSSAGSVAYPVRFSRDKKRDAGLNLEEDEVRYMKETANRKNLVVFDEDSYTGDTMKTFYEIARTGLFPFNPILLAANYRDYDESEGIEVVASNGHYCYVSP